MASEDSPESVFVDTCILVSFVQREWERNRSTAILESDKVDVVVSPNVLNEFNDVVERRRDIYEDLIDFLLENEGQIEDYDPGERRVYIGQNDATHVRNIQMTLASLDNRQEVLRRLRRFVRAAGKRADHLESSLEDSTVDPLAPFSLELALGRIINNGADVRIVTDAAGWTAEGGSGIFATLDGDDILEYTEEIVDLLADEQGSDWVIDIVLPKEVEASYQSMS
ncbi:hypothetical protein [Natranaeroarchaeum sulfidigenes]|uniref:DUF4935 domain-containing protein n=1 Tax=Natranaeroarchaeum sulfidigenes TaxID=2784880 RepID=A0A897MQG4_9EURY|nr:hypothetical protein [Natranaeroarchaeum sulfidigenes]QSG02824.1 hypothetical protein AArcS_1613 [Natranaeroarchaeum sulfidigenes]